ncbi:Sperm flagellar protein 2 [Camponotus floridanus]|uniref:Sperm flagellar protein 2 n=1 Tax=Camponotus floridanus TaxID=104421 RepID=E2AJD4_CAMFO|nr:Sperm flagellar protein 2 [Camponotus floridanus]
MADALRAWLRTRLGVIIDLTPEMFGRYTRDGTLLAQILHSYDIISSNQLSTILRTQDPALCRVNLRTLRIWLKLINVTLSDECIDKISKGKGAAALQLYYKVYLSLEGKDRLHFIALQKERKYMPSRFDISKVSEEPPSYHPPEHPLSQPLIEAADTVLWHRNKFWAITQACRRERQRFEALMKYPIVEPIEHFIPEVLPDEKEIESEALDEFARKHPPHKMKRYRVVECCPEKKSLEMPCIKDSAAATEYIDLLKRRSEKATKSHALKLKIQTTMMTEAWEQLLRKQDRSFDEALGRRVLDQSRYEKQMMRKLCEVRDLRNRIVENRRIVDAMLLNTRENELRLKEDRRREIMKEEMENVEMESHRMRELRWRIREEKVDDFRMELWDLCDARRHKAEEERKYTLQNKWIPVEAVILVNVYIGILQAEVDRFIETMQFLQDYYISMSQKPLQEPRFSKIILNHVALTDILLETSLFEDEERMLAKIESTNASPRKALNIHHFKTEIETLLIDTSKSFDPDQSIIYNIIKDNIRQVQNVVDSISSTTLEMLKNEEKIAISKSDVKSKNIGNASPDSTFAKLAERNRDLIEEWRYAVLFEIDRINQRLDVLNAAARFNIIFLLDTMKEVFHGVYHHIIERYKREIESINEMTNVFCFAIEEEKPIQQELLLDGDQFVVRLDDFVPEDPKRFAIPTEEVSSPLRFRMVQLSRLIDIFRRIAPRGIMSERALIYVLQDLVSCGEEDCYPPFVPCVWQQLRPPDIEKLIEELFGATEYIEWREFVVYAMDLPFPSHQDILKARTIFRMQDSDLKETITRDQFHSTPLWFLEISTFHKTFLEEGIDCNETMNVMLREEVRLGERISNIKSNFIETTFCKDEDPREGLGKAFTLTMGARICTDVIEGEKYVEELIEKKRRDRELQLSQDYLREEANEIVREIINHILNRTAKAVVTLEKIHDHDLPPKRRILIQQLNGMGEIDPAELLPPEEIVEHLVVEDLLVFTEYEHEPQIASPSADEAPEEMIQRDERVIFWLPRDVCLTVLSTCLPWLASQPNLFQTSMSLRQGIARIYDELRDEELNDDKDLVLSHRLLNHNFIHELLCASSKILLYLEGRWKRANLGDQIYHKPSLSSFADNREKSIGAARYRHVTGSPVKQPAAPRPISAPDFRRRRCGRWRPLAVATVARRDVLRGGLVRESFASLSFYNKRPGEQQLSAHRRRHARRDVDSSSLDRTDNSVRGRRGGEGEEERAKLKSEPTLGGGAPENHNASLRQSRIVKAATAPPDPMRSRGISIRVYSRSFDLVCARDRGC